MEMDILKKKLSTYRNNRGQVRGVPDDLLLEVLRGWEEYLGPKSGFYTAIGVSSKGMASMLGKAKKLKREGRVVASSEFTEVTSEGFGISGGSTSMGSGIELSMDGGSVIRFPRVDDLIEFLRKAA